MLSRNCVEKRDTLLGMFCGFKWAMHSSPAPAAGPGRGTYFHNLKR